MKLDNKGWGLNELIICICVMAFALILVVVLINGRLKSLIGGETVKNPSMSNEIENKSDSESVINTDKKIETTNVYEKLEEKVLLSAQNYVNKYPEYKENIITINTLKGEGTLDNFKDPDNENVECSGYVKLKKDDGKFIYDVYIKCEDNYETIGYDNTLDYTNKDLKE